MKYLIWSYEYDHASAGQKALHRLCHELNEAGQEAYVSGTPNPEWDTPQSGPLDGDWTAVYPEIVAGNPWNAPHVARWVLNVPGLLGGDTTYDSSETVFSWSPDFLPGAPLLQVPIIEPLYSDRGEPRSGEAFYVGKGDGMMDGTIITLAMRRDRHALADLLNHVTVLHTFDPVSGMIEIAGLCGCPVHVVPTGEWIEPARVRALYAERVRRFPGQLAEFIRLTSRVAVPA